MATLTPSWPSRTAMAWPMPELPPVTTATLSRSPCMTSLLVVCVCRWVRLGGPGRGVGLLPVGADLGPRRVEVGLGAPEQVLQVRPQLVAGGPTPETVDDVPLVDNQPPGGEHERVRDGGVVVGVGVLADVQRALHVQVLVGEEGPVGAGGD